MGPRIIQTPPDYSPADREKRADILGRLDSLARVYFAAAEPLTAELAKIDARYAPRVIILHDPHDGSTPPHILEG